MPDPKEKNQLFFDFEDFSGSGTSQGDTSDRKVKDDLTPGLFDPELSEEEEMDEIIDINKENENENEDEEKNENKTDRNNNDKENEEDDVIIINQTTPQNIDKEN